MDEKIWVIEENKGFKDWKVYKSIKCSIIASRSERKLEAIAYLVGDFKDQQL